MPVNSNIVKPINNQNRYVPQPGGSLINRSVVVNPPQQASRPGPINSPYPTNSMAQRTVGGTPLMPRTNGRIASNVPSWNYTPGSALTSQNLTTRQQPFTGYPSALHNVHSQPPNDILDMSEFPALGSSNTTANNSSTSGLGSSYATTAGTSTVVNGPNDGRSLHHQPQQAQEFTIDDFPALPGATSNGGNRGIVGTQPPSFNMTPGLSSSSIQDGRLGLGGIRTTVQPQINSMSEQDKKVGSTPYSTTSTLVGVPPYSTSSGISANLHSSNSSTINQSPSTSSITSASGDSYGLMGLLSVIRMTDPDLSMLALGSDLATLGLNLNSPDSALYTTFTSPWADNNQIAGLIEPDYQLPSCYNVQPPPPAQSKISSFSDETLFYIFYSMPRDILQEAAAQELYNRNWRYHREYKLWLTKEPGTEPAMKSPTFERGNYIFFDPNNWEKTKEIYYLYESLEDRPPMMGGLSGMGGVAASQAGVSSLASGGLHQQQQGITQQGLSSVNMAGLMGLGGMPSSSAAGLSAGTLAGLGASPAHMQLHHQYPSASNATHHQLGGPIPGAHYVAQGGLKDY
ncbi:11472_t:CDS:2 [Ambispora gerdemannii]|uniref:11472_t:CDS:1 n=1 Tax=Ambispora gerdemannii TaxID=144530 RepID=A0A9N9AFR2_9GLOM|nr:11472_t:CDS:2 [Ambispora gerdemannii]